MLVLDPGHVYELRVFDAASEQTAPLAFMKREGLGYPFNVGHHAGTNCQEVLRALIDRVKYLQHQIPCPENLIILAGLRSALVAFEIRAARRHGRELTFEGDIEDAPTCRQCGHIGCEAHLMPPRPAQEGRG